MRDAPAAPPPAPTTGSIADALAQADALLAHSPARAAAQARLVLDGVAGHPHALLILGTAQARLGDTAQARAILEPLARSQPRAARVHQEWGLLLATLGQAEPAIAALRHAVALKPDLPQAWRVLGDLLILADRPAEADAAYARHLQASTQDAALMPAALALVDDDLPRAEHLLRDHLRQVPTDVAALRMLAELATRLGRYPAAEALLDRCLALAPGFLGARHNLAIVLYRQSRGAEALPHLERLAAAAPDEANYRSLLAAVLAGVGDYDRAIELYAALAATLGANPRLWLSYGHALRTAGRHDACVRAYRRAIALAPTLGEAWWSLANLKTGALDAADEEAIARARATPGLSAEDRFHLDYAAARAREDAGDDAAAWAHYSTAAAGRRAQISYDPDAVSVQVARTIATLTPDLLAARAGSGCHDPAPIFIVGLPRSGSTLLEQMLASHSQVEGTMELPELPNLVHALTTAGGQRYPDCLATLPPDRLAELGAEYLQRARPYRKTDRPRFIDKLPNNWLHAGLVALILPNATIIDARRDPMATCFSAYKQHFARGQHYSYDLTELGRFYTDYIRMMDHLDRVLPGRVHRVHYEAMVDDTPTELHRLLAHCGLADEPGCLQFHRNPRAVRTASSEQVRRPIFREGLDHWRRYEQWLGPLATALQLSPVGVA